jgi:AraC family ethanolamine operon transcriptional activator
LMQQIADITQDDPRKFLTHGIARLRPQAAAQLRQAAMAFLSTAKGSLVIPGETSTLPEMTEPIIELVACALVSSKPTHHEKISFNRQRRLIRSAEEYVAHLRHQPLRIGLLCREVGTSERTLRNTFHNLTGKSPLSFLKTEQLNRVFRILRDAEPSNTLVKQVAVAHGFNHLGQFSRDYNQLFGEFPSKTLRRCSS